jgi:DNA-binding transcriptional LysR family regulator
MQIKYLEYLVTLAKERHFGRASKVLMISQPALSQAIRQIEKHFAVPIVHRHQTGFHGFTEQGEAILNWAQKTLADHDRLVGQTNYVSHAELRGTLRIGLAPIAMSIVSLLTTPFNDLYPNVKIVALAKTLGDVERGLKEFDLDIGVNYLDGITKTGLRTYDLYSEDYYLLVPEGHYLADYKSIGWKEAGELPLCLLTQDLFYRILLDRQFSAAGVAPTIVLETNSHLALYAHMRSRKWLTIVPHSYFYLFRDWAFVRAIPLVNPVATNTMGMLILERSPIAAVVEAFIDVVEETKLAEQLERYRP